MNIEIDGKSGFCDGVMKAIQIAENYLKEHHHLYCLGDIVHNNEEVNRLQSLGLEIITPAQFLELRNTTVLIRAHGESPETYQIAKHNNITLIDATCPVVLQLQKRIKKMVELHPDSETVIFGKEGHAEVIGLIGQTAGKGKVISAMKDIETIDFQKSIYLYAQTTQNQQQFHQIALAIREKKNNEEVHVFDTICKRVANRVSEIEDFVRKHDINFFVSDYKSSNGTYLYKICKEANPNTFFIAHLEEINNITVPKNASIGICGATSTPLWLMKKVASEIEKHALKH